MNEPVFDQSRLQAETFLNMSLTVIPDEARTETHAAIMDGAARRRLDQETEPEMSEEVAVLTRRLMRIEWKIDALVSRVLNPVSNRFTPHHIILGSERIELIGYKENLKPGRYIDLRFVLATHLESDIILLAKVLPPSHAERQTLEILEIAPDHTDWIIRYLIQRQREEALQAYKQRQNEGKLP